MRRLLLALAVVVGLVVPNESALIGALKFTNGSNQYVLAPASSTLNNLNTVTVVMWASVTTLVPAAQRNFFGKALGNNNWVGYLNAAGVQAAYGRVSGTGALAAAPTSNFAAVATNVPLFWAFQSDINTTANNRVLIGSLTMPASEPSSYTAGTPRTGSGSHDDSGSQMTIGNGSGGGTTNTLPGTIYTFQAFGRILSTGEIRELQYRWRPRYAGCVLSYRIGASGPANVRDECNNQLHATVSGSPPLTGDVLPRVMFARPGL